MAQWMQEARDRMKKKGTVGSFGAKAAAAGQGTQQFARAKYNAPGTLGKEARFAANAGGASRDRLRKALRGGS